MKRFLRRSIFALAFTFAFLFCGAMQVTAAEAALNNTNIKGVNATYGAEDGTYYAINGSASDKAVKLTRKQNGQRGFMQIYYSYTARVSVVKCSTINAEGACDSWVAYNYNTAAKGDVNTMDDLKKGLTLSFNNLTTAVESTEINGAKLAELTSVYGVDKTYFVIVQYKLNKTGADTYYDPDVFKVVFTEDIGGFSTPVQVADGNNVNITLTSSTPIKTIRYFYSTTELSEGFDFDTEYEASGNGVEIVGESIPMNGKYMQTITIDKEEGVFYYMHVTDEVGNELDYDVNKGTTNQNEGEAAPPSVDNPSDNKVGKIILIALLVVLVLAVVLIIVQRIVDYRKKLY